MVLRLKIKKLMCDSRNTKERMLEERDVPVRGARGLVELKEKSLPFSESSRLLFLFSLLCFPSYNPSMHQSFGAFIWTTVCVPEVALTPTVTHLQGVSQLPLTGRGALC